MINTIETLNIILSYIQRLELYVEGFEYQDFCDNLKVFDAVCMVLQEIGKYIGELDKGILPKKFSTKDLKLLNNKIIYNYNSIENRKVWDIIKESIPELKLIIEKLLKSF